MKTFNPHHIGNTLKQAALLSTLLTAFCGDLSAAEPSASCPKNAMQKSQSFIRFILGDINDTYTQVGGGGISNIKQIATNFFLVSISQEERIDQISYELKFEPNCQIILVDRKISADSPWAKHH